jgi:hypothetical protein
MTTQRNPLIGLEPQVSTATNPLGNEMIQHRKVRLYCHFGILYCIIRYLVSVMLKGEIVRLAGAHGRWLAQCCGNASGTLPLHIPVASSIHSQQPAASSQHPSSPEPPAARSASPPSASCSDPYDSGTAVPPYHIRSSEIHLNHHLPYILWS